VLLVPDHPLFPPDAYEGPPAVARRSPPWPGASINLSAARCLAELGERLRDRMPADVLLVGSGNQRRRVEQALGGPGRTRITAVDVDVSADVDAFCDAMALPFPEASFDAVLTTAVLEHVADPPLAVAEIHRVLRPGGLVFSELPFMQQVHEGAYDFTRFTHSGHRRLFRHFDELDSGLVAGPATALLWSIEHFALAVAGGGRRRRLAVKLAVRGALFWLKYLDRVLAARAEAYDGASCTYFVGRRRDGEPVSDAEIVAGYRGAQRLSHT
jgi:SAM-dependent methyltransferase